MNNTRPSERSVFLRLSFAALLFSAWAGFADAAEPIPELRYTWKAGEVLIYNVTIEADYGDYLEILSGNPAYEVKAADRDGIKLLFRGSLTERQELKPEKKGILLTRPRSPFSPFTGVGAMRTTDLTINASGEVVSSKGSTQLPFLLGDLSQLMLDHLPKESEKTWKQSIPMNLVEGGLPHSPFGRDDRTQIKANMEIRYAVEQVTEESVMVSRKVEMKTTETVGGKPRIEIEGEGTLTFDRKLNGFSKLEAQEKLIVRDANTTHETPVKIRYRLLSEAEKKQLAQTAEGTVLFPAEPLSEALQKQALADLRSGDKLRLYKVLNLLQSKEPAKTDKEPSSLQKEIAQALEGVLTGTDATMRFPSAKALVNWATADSIPTLLKTLDSADLLPRQFAMETLGKLKAEVAVEAIAKRLADVSDRLKAHKALEAIGSKAEPILLKYADHKDWAVRNEVCTILGAIGTEKSLPTLMTMQQSDAHILVKRNAKLADEAIEKRK